MQAKISATTIRQLQAQDKPFEVVDTEIKGFLLRVQPTGRKTFYYTYRTQSGKRKRIKIGVQGSSKTVAQARDDALDFAGKVSRGVDIQSDKIEGRREAKAQEKNSVSIFIEEHYMPWALANTKSGQQTINSVIRSFPDLLNTPMTDIQIKYIEKWRTDRLDAGLKPTTINRVVNALRSVLTKAVEWSYIDAHPLAGLRNLKVDEGKKARYLSDQEETRLFAALAARDGTLKTARASGNKFRAERGYPPFPNLDLRTYADRMTPLVTLSLKSGMRRGEAFDLLWSDVDLVHKVMTIKGETAKSSKTRHIPLSPTAILALTAWREQAQSLSGRVFPATDGGRLNNVNKSWASILKSAEIIGFRWHDMRHDFASKLVMRGVPLNTVRELCGHASLNTTLRYAHLAPDHKADAIALIG
jgi:integrase